LDGHSSNGKVAGRVADLFPHLDNTAFGGKIGPVRKERTPSSSKLVVLPQDKTPLELTKDCIALGCTDNENGNRFIRRYGSRIRHNPALGFLCWDGRRWAVDEHGQIAEFAKETAKQIYAEAALLDDKGARDLRSS